MAPGHTLMAADGMVWRCNGQKSVAVHETMDTDGINPRLYAYDGQQCKYCNRDKYEVTRHAHEDHAWEDDDAWKVGMGQVPKWFGEKLREVYVKEKAAAKQACKVFLAKKEEELAQAGN